MMVGYLNQHGWWLDSFCQKVFELFTVLCFFLSALAEVFGCGLENEDCGFTQGCCCVQ